MSVTVYDGINDLILIRDMGEVERGGVKIMLHFWNNFEFMTLHE
jgi:hypothetical protein